jgi:CBS domain-containing protein
MTTIQSKCSSRKVSGHRPVCIDREASVLDASKLMRQSDSTELLVTHEVSGRQLPLAIVTASDIVKRVLAAELDPEVLTMGDIAWPATPSADQGDSDAEATQPGNERLAGTLRRTKQSPLCH